MVELELLELGGDDGLTVGVFFAVDPVVVLVGGLGGKEGGGFGDLSNDGPGEVLLDGGAGVGGEFFLFVAVVEDTGAVLGADVGALAVELGGVVQAPEPVK